MKNDVKLGFSECFGLVTICIITKMFYGFLPFQVQSYAASAWYINIISAFVMFAAFYVAVKAGGYGRVAGFFVFVYFLLYTAMNLRETVRVIKIYNFPETPEWVFAFAFLLIAVIICKNDIFGGAKLAGLYSKLIIGAFVVIFLVGLKQYDFVNLTPYGGYGLLRTAKGGIAQMTVFSDIFLLLFLIIRAGGRKTAVRCGIWSMAVSAIITALSAICYISVFDYSVAGGKSSGLIEVVKNAYYGHLFQRMESLFFLVMIIASAVSVCVWLSMAVYMYSDVFGIGDASEIVIPISFILLFLTLSEFRGLFEAVGRYGGIFLAFASVISYCSRRKI